MKHLPRDLVGLRKYRVGDYRVFFWLTPSRRGRRPKVGVPPQELLDLLLFEPQSLEMVAQHLDKLAALLLRALANQGGNRLEPARRLVRLQHLDGRLRLCDAGVPGGDR